MSETDSEIVARAVPNEWNCRPLAKVPPLQFKDGDVLIRLSVVPDDCLLLHSSVLKKRVPQLAPIFKETWCKSDRIKHPLTGHDVEIFTLGLKVVEDRTVLLEGKFYLADDSLSDDGMERDTLIHGSNLASPGWPDYWGVGFSPFSKEELITRTAELYFAFFALVYSQPITLDPICRFEELEAGPWNEPRHRKSLQNAFYIITAFCALAEYHDALGIVAPAVADLLLAFPSIWRDIAEHPVSWYRLAVKLRSKPLILDALRHLIGSANFHEIAFELNMTRQEAELAFRADVDGLNRKMSDIRNFLLIQGLPKHSLNDRTAQPVGVMSSLQHAGQRRIELLALRIYSQWVTTYITDTNRSWPYECRDPRSGLGELIEKLLGAGSMECPAGLIESHPAESWSDIYQIGPFVPDAADRLRDALNELILEACGWLNSHFRVDTTWEWSSSWTDRTTPRASKTFRRAHFDGVDGVFTYLPLDETKFPEVVEWGVETLPSVNLELLDWYEMPTLREMVDRLDTETDFAVLTGLFEDGGEDGDAGIGQAKNDVSA